ncbi:MAG: type II secretion system GspH family protein [Firmicutes bacterium]|nr:type II secretion system GspH family protein [Bacillota bacterium]
MLNELQKTQKSLKNSKNNGGFSYVEILVAMAILTIIMLPIFPAIMQAQANHTIAINRRVAQGQAATLATNLQAGVDISNITGGDSEFIYRITWLTNENTQNTEPLTGNTAELVGILPPVEFSLSNSNDLLFANSEFILVEIFDVDGVLLGMSVGQRTVD